MGLNLQRTFVMDNLFAKRPHVLEPNRVARLYRGGAALDRWQNRGSGRDGYQSEEFIVSTIRYIGPGTARNEGISMTCLDQKEISLSEMIEAGETDFLGKQYAFHTGGHLGVLARVGDSVERLIIQAHPTGAYAKKYLQVPFGKTEAWYIVDTREYDSGFCYAGFKKGVARRDFEHAFHAGDSNRMLDMMHKINFRKGDLLFVPSGMIHAMGPGATFLEFHEPCDYTMRYEKYYSGKTISEDELHYGLGVNRLLECVNDVTYSEKEIEKLVRKEPILISSGESGTIEELLSYKDTPYFSVRKMTVKGTLEVPRFMDSHCILITVEEAITLKWDNQREHIGRGCGVVVPAGVGRLWAEGQNAEVLIGYPFLTNTSLSL